ncbi:FAD-dependent oxidoreductase [Hyperthermus butylicus]|uniref:NADH oxidase n=1 Tax=Hyperthermus butylicus (strain DSM 5456 / JCM 9403 / PLM1-5) TaxID=415426 RepID=A2BKZ4_HYPBU|nr:FAD-dependent oxidoreductase [Hyperthermus butylicus]ABM80655.1 NADH oxidase [Hyperthermus butylicus DSM 5456]
MLRVAVIGGGAAGMATASRVKRLLRDRAEVVVFEKTPWVSFALCGTPYYLSCKVKTLNDLLHYPLEEFTEKRGINVMLRTEVTDVELDARRLRYRRLDTGETGVYEFDYVVFATGARPRAPKNWLRFRNVFTLHSLADADRLREAVVRDSVRRVIVIGAGYTGIEAADNIALLGRRVVIVHSSKRILSRSLDPDIAEKVEERAKTAGIEFVLGRSVVDVEGSEGYARSVVLDNGEKMYGDLFVVSMGIEPNVELARRAGVRIGGTGAIWVDTRLRTSREEAYAVGDVAETVDILTGERIWWPFATAANKMGFVAGTNIAGGDAFFPGVVRTRAMGAFGLYIAGTGLLEEEARRMGFDVVTATLTAHTRARYMGHGPEIVLKVLADANTGMLLGAQALSEDPSAFWRIAVVATLLMKKASVWDLFNADIGYWPGVNTVWDPLVVAARLLLRRLGTRPREVSRQDTGSKGA